MSVIDDYLSGLPPAQQIGLEQVRKVIHRAIPDAEEVISYGIPAFKLNGVYVIGFAAFKDHLGVFPTPEPIAILQDKLANFKVSKGGIQFTSENPLPPELIKALVTERLKVISKKPV